MKILITGTHFTPAQAVIEELVKHPEIEIVYLGRSRTLEGDKTESVESQVLPKLGVKFIPITAGRLRRFFSVYTILSLLKIPIGFVQSFFYVLKENPSVVVSFGGYVGLPVVFCSWLLSKKILVHEQTLVSGLSNTVSQIFADKVAVSFEKNYSFAKNKTVLTGNPVRKEVLVPSAKGSSEINSFLDKHKKTNLPLLLITGGNQGSHTINQLVFKIVGELSRHFFVIHQTGDSKYKDYEAGMDVKSKLKNAERYFVCKWIQVLDWGVVLKNADLALTRGGINTLLELSYHHVPALVIPLPDIFRNEQFENAKYFQKEGYVHILSQSELNEKTLTAKLLFLKNSKKTLEQKTRSIFIPDAALNLVLEILLLESKKDF